MRNLVKRNREDREPAPWGNFENAFETLQREINDVFEGHPLSRVKGLRDTDIAPPIDIEDNPEDIRITCELPGVDKNDVEVSISGNVVTISGEKKDEKEKRNGRYYRKENWYGRFERSITLPAGVDTEKVDGEMKHGVLTLTMPKNEESKQKRITVNVK